MMSEDLAQKKLRGSGGYALARVTDEEQKKGNLGGPELFLAGIGRLDEGRFEKYFCNKCEKEYEGSPAIVYENPNEDLGEGVTLVEKGEYKCKACNGTIAQYRKFDATSQQQQPARASPAGETQPDHGNESSQQVASTDFDTTATSATAKSSGKQEAEFIPLDSFIGMQAYNSEAELVGKVQKIGLRKIAGSMNIVIQIGEDLQDGQTEEIPWSGISKIGDIVLLSPASGSAKAAGGTLGKCLSCGYQNESGAAFCEECGAKLA